MNLVQIKEQYLNGVNITQYLQKQSQNSIDAIEISYDLQSGSYIENVINNQERSEFYIQEISNILNQYIIEGDSILDCGTGEMTTLAGVISNMPTKNNTFFCFDISLSRLLYGCEYIKHKIDENLLKSLNPFVAEFNDIPILDNAINIVWTSHAIEPNFGRESEILAEIFRVASRYAILFEPSYEYNTLEGRKRMQELGYVRDLPKHIASQGGQLEQQIKIKNTVNPLNPTYAYIVNTSNIGKEKTNNALIFADPANKTPLTYCKDCYYGEDSLMLYPIISNIPILRKKYAIIGSHYENYKRSLQNIFK